MSQLKFDPRSSSVILDVQLEGKIILHARLILDTGASFVVLPWRISQELGLKINSKRVISTTTASKVETVPITTIPEVTTLAKSAFNVSCLVEDLPAEAGVDGLLGLSYLRNFHLSLDFKNGILQLE